MTKTASNAAVKNAETQANESKPTMSVVADQVAEVIAPEPVKELTLEERIQRVESLQLMVSKRAKLISARGDLERFQISSNDFNCQLDLSDSDGNKFRSSFTPGVKKVVEFLKKSFDDSIREVEQQIQF